MDENSRASGGASRRRILQGAAWAAPAVVVASAVPATAGSLDPSGTIVFNIDPPFSLGSWYDPSIPPFGANRPVYVVQNQIRWAGPFNNGNDVSGILATFRVPKAESTAGAFTILDVQTGWTPVQRTETSTDWVYSSSYGPTIGGPNYSAGNVTTTTTLSFRVLLNEGAAPSSPGATFIVTASTTGIGNNSPQLISSIT